MKSHPQVIQSVWREQKKKIEVDSFAHQGKNKLKPSEFLGSTCAIPQLQTHSTQHKATQLRAVLRSVKA